MAFNGQGLYRLRLKRNMSRADLAHAIRRGSNGHVKATERGIRGWEKGEYTPRGDAVPAIAHALDCEVSELFSENGHIDDEEAARAMSLDDYLWRRVREIMAEERKERERS